MPELTEHELETAKLYHDAYKHVTTFCSGAILLSSSVVAAFFSKADIGWFLILSVGAFLVGAAAATLGLWNNVEYLDANFRESDPEVPATKRRTLRRQSFWVSVIAAYAGVVLFSFYLTNTFNVWGKSIPGGG